MDQGEIYEDTCEDTDHEWLLFLKTMGYKLLSLMLNSQKVWNKHPVLV